jgi:hypothetical protein
MNRLIILCLSILFAASSGSEAFGWVPSPVRGAVLPTAVRWAVRRYLRPPARQPCVPPPALPRYAALQAMSRRVARLMGAARTTVAAITVGQVLPLAWRSVPRLALQPRLRATRHLIIVRQAITARPPTTRLERDLMSSTTRGTCQANGIRHREHSRHRYRPMTPMSPMNPLVTAPAEVRK